MKKLVIFTPLFALLIACGDPNAAADPVVENINQPEVPVIEDENSENEVAIIGHFEFTIINDTDQPSSIIAVQLQDEKVDIDEIMGVAAVIEPSEYKSMGIPDEAIDACGAWWAGGGDYYYLMPHNGELAVYAGWTDESVSLTEGYHWEERMTLPE